MKRAQAGREQPSRQAVTRAKRYIAESASVAAQLTGLAPTVVRVAQVVAKALAAGRRVYLMGNGGSAADAQHIAGELVGRFLKERAGLAAQALTTDTSVLTAVANDYGYEEVFARQLAAHVRPGDVVIGFSTSGRSANVLRGFEEARKGGAVTVGFCGPQTEEFASRCDVVISVPGSSSPHVQDGHAILAHVLCDLVEQIRCSQAGERGAGARPAGARGPAAPERSETKG
jgi:D-sedoheptulose 7-phosphate isomerase